MCEKKKHNRPTTLQAISACNSLSTMFFGLAIFYLFADHVSFVFYFKLISPFFCCLSLLLLLLLQLYVYNTIIFNIAGTVPARLHPRRHSQIYLSASYLIRRIPCTKQKFQQSLLIACPLGIYLVFCPNLLSIFFECPHCNCNFPSTSTN